MRNLVTLLLCVLVTALGCGGANAYTMTFDDLPTASLVPYGQLHGAWFAEAFRSANHWPTNVTWGHSHSGANVVVWAGDPGDVARLDFALNPPYYPEPYRYPYSVSSLSAWFGTNTSAMVTLTAYRNDGTVVDSVVIGATGEKWENRYVEIAPQAGAMDYFVFQGVNSPDDLLNFCADDMTIVPVPEPSSLGTLGLALACAGGRLMRRRRVPAAPSSIGQS